MIVRHQVYRKTTRQIKINPLLLNAVWIEWRVSSFDYKLGDGGRVAAVILQSGRNQRTANKDNFASCNSSFISRLYRKKNLHLKLKGTMYLRNPLENYPLLVDSLKLFHRLYLDSLRQTVPSVLSSRVDYFFTVKKEFFLCESASIIMALLKTRITINAVNY